jgi:hypothetical protein
MKTSHTQGMEPELPQATFYITGEIGKPMIPVYTAEQVRAAIEADRINRASAKQHAIGHEAD